MTRNGVESDDIHNFERRYEIAIRLLRPNRRIHSENREKILEFHTAQSETSNDCHNHNDHNKDCP